MAIPILCIVAIFIQAMFAEGAVKLGTSLRPSASGQEQSWQSPGNNFSLGFHPSGDRGLYVVGISFASINDSTLVWTAGFDGHSKLIQFAKYLYANEAAKSSLIILKNA
ncbi:hypothetical protein SUGI_1089400 [Cryptomeria japonica]|nr:hypothetical protein SUGI_1089400 [Cryptomeria japonica]